jgi:hypothetical protein
MKSTQKDENHLTRLNFSIGGYLGECHEVEWKQDALWCRRAEGAYMWKPAVALSPGPEAWERFWKVLDAAGVWQWENRYENVDVLDGTQWSLELKHLGKSLTSEGSNAFPGSDNADYPESSAFGKFIKALRELTGQEAIC